MQKKIGLLAKFGVAVAVTVGGLALASPSALAAAPGYSVTPATGLSDGGAVTVTITGAGKGEQFGIVQCATVKDALACHKDTAKMVSADASGSSSSSFTVHKSYQGVTPDGVSVGAVNCAVTACFVSAGNDKVFLGSKQISFN